MVACRTPEGRRAWANVTDPDHLALLVTEEGCGRLGTLRPDGQVDLALTASRPAARRASVRQVGDGSAATDGGGTGIAVPVLEGAVGERPGQQRQPVGGQPVGQRGQHRLHARRGRPGARRPLRLASTIPSPPGVIGTRPMIPATA